MFTSRINGKKFNIESQESFCAGIEKAIEIVHRRLIHIEILNSDFKDSERTRICRTICEDIINSCKGSIERVSNCEDPDHKSDVMETRKDNLELNK